MKVILIISMMMMAVGCTTVSYKSENGDVTEQYSMTTWFKKVEDLSVIRTPDVFGLSIGSTANDDVFGAIAKIIEFYAVPVGQL